MRPLVDTVITRTTLSFSLEHHYKNHPKKEKEPEIMFGDEDEAFDDAEILFPVTDGGEKEHHDRDYEATDDDEDGGSNVTGRYAQKKKAKKEFKPLMSRRQLRRIKLGFTDHGQFPKLKVQEKKTESPTSPEPMSTTPMSAGKKNWLKAFKKIKKLEDPWAKFNINDHPIETCIRHRYNALKQKWVQDEVQVKMEKEPFNHGAMRACYRLKKLSKFSRRLDWHHAHNYVAKQYMEDVEREVYFEDVRLQMDAKLWGEEYNRHKPPKKVDIFQMNIIEFKDRPGCPLYHLEHFIEGNYIKYNSNSGFVDAHTRATPQAFSHFTFERSGHQLVLVDIQGVEDLWTDPQIHTADGKGYGDGNLGTKGMALFFHSHICNSICESLNLGKFDLTEAEVKASMEFDNKKNMAFAQTRVRGEEEAVICASPTEQVDLNQFLYLSRSRSRTLSTASSIISDLSEVDPGDEDMYTQSLPEEGFSQRYRTSSIGYSAGHEPMSPATPDRITPSEQRERRRRRNRFDSESDCSSASTLTEEDERLRFHQVAHRPANMSHEMGLRTTNNNINLMDSILGMVHHDLAKYHEMGRFSENDNDIDWEAALFHEQQAAELGVLEAILTLAKLFLGMQPDILVNCTVDSTSSENIEKGLVYMEQAARYGDRSAMLYMADAFKTGTNLGKNRSQSYSEAVLWYEKACNMMVSYSDNDNTGEFDGTMDTPLYVIKASIAEMYKEGGHELTADPSQAGDLYTEAADAAMSAMKGRLANKYYALAEEAYALVEDNEE